MKPARLLAFAVFVALCRSMKLVSKRNSGKCQTFISNNLWKRLDSVFFWRIGGFHLVVSIEWCNYVAWDKFHSVSGFRPEIKGSQLLYRDSPWVITICFLIFPSYTGTKKKEFMAVPHTWLSQHFQAPAIKIWTLGNRRGRRFLGSLDPHLQPSRWLRTSQVSRGSWIQWIIMWFIELHWFA